MGGKTVVPRRQWNGKKKDSRQGRLFVDNIVCMQVSIMLLCASKNLPSFTSVSNFSIWFLLKK